MSRWPLMAAAAGSVVLALPVGIVLLLTPAASGSCGGAGTVPAGQFTQAEISALWVQAGGSTGATEVSELGAMPDPVIAGAVGMAESGGDPTIVNGIGAGGLMQIHPPEPNYLDPATNMRIAVRKHEARGWQPWEAFTGPDGRGDDGPWRGYLNGDQVAVADCGGDLGGSAELPAGGAWLAPLPGFPGEQCDRRIIPDVQALVRRYHIAVSDCYSMDAVHTSRGEHPLGLAIDLGPGPGGSWDDVDRLARDVGWTRSCGASGVRPACPLKPWVRFAGYDGYPNHGRGNHLHLSWQHGPGSPASTVTVFSAGAA